MWSCDVHVTGMITEDPALKVLYGMYCDSRTYMMWTPWGPSVLITRVAPMGMRVWDQFIQVHVQVFKPGVPVE